jgi:hypothetical protein
MQFICTIKFFQTKTNIMKKILTVLMLAAVAIPAYCQITLTQSNYPLPEDTVALMDVTSQVSAPPTMGANQTWNYTAFTAFAPTAANVYIPVSSDPNFPNAQFYYHNLVKSLTSTLGYYFDQYYEITDTGAEVVGIHVYAQNYGLGALTGTATDTLYVLDNVITYPAGTRPAVQFPATAGSSWSSAPRNVVNMLLTVSAASLNQAPLQQAFYYDRADSVVGWGTLELPAATGYNSNVPVLEDKFTGYCVDSFYLNGSPAPTALLSGFGMTQGQQSGPTYNRIQLYRAGAFNYQMLFNYTDNTFTTLYSTGGAYYSNNLPLATGISEIAADGLSTVYPNPMNGNAFDIKMATDAPVSTVSIEDLSGRVVASITAVNTGGTVHVQVASTLSDGMYLYRVLGSDGALLTMGKIASVK